MAEASPPRRLPERPISPHLSVYRFTWTMAMSIAHRITGMALYAALPLLALYLGVAAGGAEGYDALVGLLSSWPGLAVLIGLSWATIHHAIGGVRHVVWDTGMGLSRTARFQWAQGTLAGSLLLTTLLWLAIFLGD